MKYMNFIMVPLMIGYMSYSLVFVSHTRWTAWLLSSMAGMVYTLLSSKFLSTYRMMMFVFTHDSYQLKSVSHLPWETFVYLAIGTFIDDLFAFIIYMPTMHRISCFRDDIIFFIYMYQRYIYPVDATRHLVNENNDNEEHPHKE